MVDRVEQKGATPYRIEEPDHANKEREEEGGGQESKSFFEEKTDWKLFYEKTPHRTKSKTIMTRDIDCIRFESLSLKNDPSILEIEVTYRNQNREGPMFLSVPREMAFRLQNHHKGDILPKQLLCPLHYLQVLVPEPIPPVPMQPQQPRSPSTSSPLQTLENTFRGLVRKAPSNWSWEFVILYGVCALLFVCLILVLLYL